ncbi:hypothetical protein SEPCBS57363_002374 [Sporothrix epigloea]|uniref:Dynactin 2 n=1 Tax=Sporothrix epigloea TaxID=1892477 RepID=A0ABP0DFJ5_9PEZI
MALNRKYSALPDLDTAPHVYETPELTDDNSTDLTTTGRSPSDEDSDNLEDEDEDDDAAGISRTRVHADRARSRFQGATVDARSVDFSDRIDGKRKSYRTTTRRRRRRRQQAVLGDLSEDDGEGEDSDDEYDSDSPEGLERTIARLKRKVEDAKEAYGRQAAKSKANTGNADDLASLSQALDDMTRLADEASVPLTAAASASAPAPAAVAIPTPTPAPSSAGALALAQAADFDRRLVLLEKSIGLDEGGLPRAILPTLDALQRQIGTLADASTASLDGISRRVRTLAQEADQLAKARAAAAATGAAATGTTLGTAAPAKMGDTPPSEDTKIHALYGTLPTIESLAPLLPPLLDRLRSLRAIHADAAAASELLDALTKQQAETADEVKHWRQGLETMEQALRNGEATMGKNAQVMEGWVKGLESRLEKLA